MSRPRRTPTEADNSPGRRARIRPPFALDVTVGSPAWAVVTIGILKYGTALAACAACALKGLPPADDPVTATPVVRAAIALTAAAAFGGFALWRQHRWVRKWAATTAQLLFVALVVANPTCWPFAFVAAGTWSLCHYADARSHLLPAAVQLSGFALALLFRPQPDAWIGLLALAVLAVAKFAGMKLLVLQLRADHEHYRSVVEGVNGIVWSVDQSPGAPISVSENAVPLLGWTEEQWHEPGFLDTVCNPDDLARLRDLIAGGGMGRSDGDITVQFRRADGSPAYLLTRVLPSRQHNQKGSVARTDGLFVDITRRHEAETQLRRFAEVTAHSPLACVVVRTHDVNDPTNCEICFGNPQALKLLRVTAADLEGGRRLSSVFRDSTAESLGRFLCSVARTGNPMSAERISFPERPDRSYNLRADLLSDGTVAVTVEDVSARVASDARLRHQALHDALTGLPNRMQIDESLHDAVADADRKGHRVGLLLMDLTQFKEVNDAMGHRAGDHLLVEIAHRLHSELDASVRMLGRLGGDEFAIVTPPIVDETEAIDVARRALETLERPVEIDGVPVQSSANIGIALCPDHAVNAPDLLKMADVAMYRAKRTGQGFEVYSTEHDQTSLRRVTLLGELRRAMGTGELQLHYQPAVDLKTGTVAKVEGLVRWNHRHHGQMLPSEFMEGAESTGMIHPLTRWIIVEAGRGANRLHRMELPIVVAANISVRNLQDPELVSFFELLSRTDDFHPDRLELEITETELMDDPVRAFEVLDRLRTIGVAAAIDDFGTGHSSLSYLKHMPVNHLKIDRQFVTTIATDEDDAAIVRSTIDLAHSLGLKVTAEGVPDVNTLRRLAAFGCDYACGFFISEPVSMDDLPSTIRRLNESIPAVLAAADQEPPPTAAVATPAAQR